MPAQQETSVLFPELPSPTTQSQTSWRRKGFSQRHTKFSFTNRCGEEEKIACLSSLWSPDPKPSFDGAGVTLESDKKIAFLTRLGCFNEERDLRVLIHARDLVKGRGRGHSRGCLIVLFDLGTYPSIYYVLVPARCIGPCTRQGVREPEDGRETHAPGVGREMGYGGLWEDMEVGSCVSEEGKLSKGLNEHGRNSATLGD